MDNSALWIWLNQQVCLTRSRQHRLLEHFGSIEALYNGNISEYAEAGFLKDEEINLLMQKDLDECYAELEKLQCINAGIIPMDCPRYPELLKEISSPPTVLYYRGRQVDLNNTLCISMVGTRKASYYGKSCAYTIAKELSDAGVVVVSGLAMGIDAKSHEGALCGATPTVAVIGCGVDIAYPRTNANLMENIVSSGMVVSEYPLGTNPEKYHFPERNRIISGICRGTLVVEADFKSGSLITAKTANEQNRDVFAVPGNINSFSSKGTNYLLKDGAHLVTCTEDIISFYRFECPHLLRPKKVTFEAKPVRNTAPKGSPEEKLLSALGEETLHTDTLCQLTGLDTGTVSATLLMMELSGKVTKLPGGFYTGIRNIDI